jgi:hypothetical protein
MSGPRVLLFSGHLIDARDRREPRFPPDREGQAAAAIDGVLTKLGAGAGDVGITEGACGGDLLFAESMLRREARLELRLPFPEEEFIRQSVAFEKAGGGPDNWTERYWLVRRHPRVRMRVMPDELGPLPQGADAYERCNIWMLSEALHSGASELHFIALWDGRGGDGPGGTAHMMEEVRRHGGQARWLDTRALWPQAPSQA